MIVYAGSAAEGAIPSPGEKVDFALDKGKGKRRMWNGETCKFQKVWYREQTGRFPPAFHISHRLTAATASPREKPWRLSRLAR